MFCHIRLNGDGFSTVAGDFSNHLVRAGFAGGVIDDDGSSFSPEVCGDGRADAFGGSGDHCHLAAELVGICFHMTGCLLGFVFLSEVTETLLLRNLCFLCSVQIEQKDLGRFCPSQLQLAFFAYRRSITAA